MGVGTLGFCSCDPEAFNARRHQADELPHVAAPFALVDECVLTSMQHGPD